MIRKLLKEIVTTTTIALLLLPQLLLAQINYPVQSEYAYLKGNAASALGADWVNPSFNDAGWSKGNAPFRYGDGTGGTDLTDMQGSYSTLYLRSSFTVTNLADIETVRFSMDWDDGFVLWINGVEALSQMAPADRTYDALSSGLHESGIPETFSIRTRDLDLVEGTNTIAIQAFNTDLSTSSDFYIDMSIAAATELPDLPETIDSVGLSFSHDAGFYSSNFTLLVRTTVSGASIVYTLDGSSPQNSLSRFTAGTSVSIPINPSSTTGRGTTPAVVVRASIVKDGLNPSKPELRTFIFTDKVKTQTYPGGSWPNYNVNDQILDYDMDAEVVNSSAYSGQIESALKDIPTISIATDNANLFDPTTGIYVNALEQGYDWERECSVELIDPNGSDEFNVNAGLRIRGGWSRHPNYRKHSFRLFFREEYGNAKLEFPLFGDEGVSKFDKIDLRTAQNYSWANGSGQHNTFVREVFTRDSQGDMGQPYTKSRYYHLYVNGMYWGLFQTQERAEARFASDYLGGSSDDYDVIKIGGTYDKTIQATDGNLDAWERVWELCRRGFINQSNYYKLQGLDKDGNPQPGLEVMVDIDNLIDYMINIFYTGNYDAPVSAWGGNKNPNNMYAIVNREDKSEGFKFFIHDGEHTLMTGESSGPGIGIEENRADLGVRTGDDKMEVTNFDRFHSQWLHYKLSFNEDYRMRFADRANKHFTGNGVFTQDECVRRFNKRVNQIDMAIIAESARWGDSNRGEAYTKDNAWLPELNDVKQNYFPYRTDIVIDQLEELDLMSDVTAPVYVQSGTALVSEKYPLNSPTSVKVKNPGTTGQIYYTLNGKDPRLSGGDVSSEAIKADNLESIEINSSKLITARVLKGGVWSALSEVSFFATEEDYSNLKVTELHYHPTDSIIGVDTISGGDYEFVEFKNISTSDAIDLSGLVIDSAIYYEFPQDQLLAPQQLFVVAAKPKKFFDRYGMIPSGNYKNSLSNGGEQFIVFDASGNAIIDFIYDDHLPWPEEPDGDGPSLTAKAANPKSDPNNYTYWVASDKMHGTPFKHEGSATSIDETYSELSEDNLSVYPNPTNDLLTIVQLGGVTPASLNIKIYDLSGMLVYQSQVDNGAALSLQSLNISSGIYILSVESDTLIQNKKIVYSD